MQGTPLAATSKINRMTRQITLATLTPGFLLAFDSNHAAAQAYPSKPVRVVTMAAARSEEHV